MQTNSLTMKIKWYVFKPYFALISNMPGTIVFRSEQYKYCTSSMFCCFSMFTSSVCVQPC